jgi:hypothetical protein
MGSFITMRRSLCPHCRKRLDQGQRIHPECVDGFADAQEAKALRAQAKKVRADKKAERADIQERKAKLKRIPDLIKEAQHEFNAYIRERDKDKPCICCGKPLQAGTGSTGGDFDCGHYRSTGSASHLRFNEDNAHGQRKYCNRHGAGRAVDYRIGLVGRIGIWRVEALESDNRTHKWTREELIAIKEKYRQKLKEIRVSTNCKEQKTE